MITDLNPTKLRHEHLTRPALVYVPQSTLIQVRDNTATLLLDSRVVEFEDGVY